MTAAEQPLGKDSLDSLHHDESTDGHEREEFLSLTPFTFHPKRKWK